MLKNIRSRCSYANVMATAALFLALGGTGYAATQLDGSDIKDGSLTGADIKDSSLKSPDIATNGVTGADIAPNAVTGSDVAPNAVTGADIAEQTLGTVPDASQVGGNDIDASSLVHLEPGQTKQLIKQGPFTLTAACEPAGARLDGGAVPVLRVASTVPGEFHVGTGTGTLAPQNGIVSIYLGAQASGVWATTPYSAATAAGERAFGIAGAGRDVFGSTCVITVFQLG